MPPQQQQWAQPPATGQPAAQKSGRKMLVPILIGLVILLGAGAAVAMKWGPDIMAKFAKSATAAPDNSPAPAPPPATDADKQQQSGVGVQTDDERQKQLEEEYQKRQQEGGSDQGAANDQDQQQDPGQAQDQGQAAPAPAPAPVAARPAVAAAPAPVAAAPVAAAPVAAAPVAAPVAAAPAPAPVVAAAPGYDKMVAQAEDMINSSQYDEAANLLKTAIKANPAKWQAYNALAKDELYFLHDTAAAFADYQKSLAHGGQATFYVYHDHGTGEFAATCSGWLTVSRGRASFKADDGAHNIPASPVKEAKKNKFFGKFLSASGKSAHAFHIRLMSNQLFNFAPSSGVPGPEADFIVKALGAGE